MNPAASSLLTYVDLQIRVESNQSSTSHEGQRRPPRCCLSPRSQFQAVGNDLIALQIDGGLPS